MATVSAFIAFLCGRNRPVGPVEKVLFGIGNPGSRYKKTRHNTGFLAIDWFARSATHKTKFRSGTWEAILCKRESLSFALVKPKTYVNRCGEALVDCIELMQCPLSSCLVIVDDYHLPLGTIRIRPGGSDGGHNGLKSIIERVGAKFPRLRIGIGPVPENTESVGFVLGSFNKNEQSILQNALTRAEGAMLLFAQRGIDAAMNAYNE